ncbi:MAG: 50S ribosomal protein L4 [Clostridia bacterium]|nr:50S ribosomal protein L4 [Oscillospiraceae bacterium]MBP3599485.1 50S ribosomal protein L4 [Clostridia bacterium]
MPNIAVLDMAGKNVGEITLSDAIFGITPNAVVMHMAVINYLANQRQGTQSTLTRTEVSGGGKKPWRQKGTGHARQGSTRAPQWRHGGIVHAPKPRDYSYSLNKKVRKLALLSALSDKALSGDIIVLDELKLETYKTKVVADCLKAIGAGKKALIVLENNDAFAVKSIANIAGAKSAQVNTINTYDIINADTLVIVKGAVAKLEEVYA